MRRWAADSARPLRLDVVGDYENAVAHVASGESAALGADDVLPAGYIAERGLLRLRCGWRTAVCEPYGITSAKDDTALAEVEHAAFT